MAASERIPVLATPEEKRRITKRAKQYGFKSVGSFLKEAADAYVPISKSDENILERMLIDMRDSTETTSKGIDEMLAEVAESEARIASMESSGRTRMTADLNQILQSLRSV